MSKLEEYLNKVYYDPNHRASYSSASKLYRVAKEEVKEFQPTLTKIVKWLQSQEPHSLHKAVQHKFKHLRVLSPRIDYQWDADTAHMSAYSKKNRGYAYFLLVIDIMSRYIWTRPLKTKKGEEMAKAFKDIFDTSGRHPYQL